ncbi:MAG TPA: phosphoribosylglycinamide formyltransferase [Tepidisphaeraceae bacterium]|jgi:formyltetrahydrofolate-dependent phosphoribosylglycinamide formyltransferase|nr:phosphoribosylglycinamide formyltransferase [Tepidisphaeraceae bacterium]
MPERPIQLAVLVSGSGTTLQNLIDQIDAGRLNAQIRIVVGSRPGLVGLQRATKAGLRSEVVDRRAYSNCFEFSRKVFGLCAEAKVDLVCMAGWLCLVDLPPHFGAKVLNIHPALLPSFGGRGMYGRKVHEAVIAHGCKVSGCTVHFVDSSYDTGPIVLQRACPVLEDDTPEELAHRVFEEEKIAYPEAIRLFQAGRLKTDGRRVHVLPPDTNQWSDQT